MKIAKILKEFLWFNNPQVNADQKASSVHAFRWKRWQESAIKDEVVDGTEKIAHRIFAALKRDIVWALIAIFSHTTAAFGAAVTLKLLLTQLLQENSLITSNVIMGGSCVILTYFSWLALNHTFFLAELIGIGGRSYVEQRIFLRKKSSTDSTHSLSIISCIDREATRVEAFWTGLVTFILALSTVISTSIFFFLSLGISALAALFIIAVSSLIVFLIAQELNEAYEQLSKSSSQRIEIGTFFINNKRQAWLRNWTENFLCEYANRRDLESDSLKKAAQLIAKINLVSTISPMLALLSSAFLQLIFMGSFDTPSILSAIALLGGLRSVANIIPDVVQSISKGVVGHRNIENYLTHCVEKPDFLLNIDIPETKSKHIAIVGEAGSGKTTFLKAFAKESYSSHIKSLYIPDEPWVYAGGICENLSLYEREFSDEDALNAIRLSRLPEDFFNQYLADKHNDKIEKWNISRGQGKRLELARAILAKPQRIFIDQPTSGLDEYMANGLLSSLLNGPWHNINVVFVTDKQQEILAAQEVWTIVDGIAVKTHKNQHDTYPEQENMYFPSKIEESYLRTAQPKKTKVEPSNIHQHSIIKSIINFGVLRLTLIAISIFSLKEALGILGDFIITENNLSSNLQLSLLFLISIILVSSLLSRAGSLITVKSTIDVASKQCINYFKFLMNSALIGTLRNQVERDNQNKLTWDQRRTDEVFPVLMLETINAATLLLITTTYVIINNLYVFIPYIIIGFSYWYEVKSKSSLLQCSNLNEINATSVFFSQIAALSWAGGRFDISRNNLNVFNWLKSSIEKRSYASLDNSAMRRWYSYKLDLNGVLFLSCIIISVIYMHATEIITTSNALALSLSYNVIAIFGRLGRCLVELSQVMDSADRIVVNSKHIERTSVKEDKKPEFVNNLPLISFVDVTYSNQKTGKKILNHFNGTFDKKDIVVITGPSGIGKSTFANLLVGDLRPSEGEIITMGQYGSYLERKHDDEIHLLTSNPIFKPGMLFEHFNHPLESVFRDKAEQLNLSPVIKKLENGLKHQVSWSGKINLSKSEQQRLALLDLMINPPLVVILDEATSELKPDDELHLLTQVTKALPNTLFFIITHNPMIAWIGTRNFKFCQEGKLVENP